MRLAELWTRAIKLRSSGDGELRQRAVVTGDGESKGERMSQDGGLGF
jgi:hypothetical protein